MKPKAFKNQQKIIKIRVNQKSKFEVVTFNNIKNQFFETGAKKINNDPFLAFCDMEKFKKNRHHY